MEHESLPPPNKLTELDRLTVELAKAHRQTALANAKAALAEQEKLELQYQVMVRNLFQKYSLSSKDRIEEDGTIVLG